MAIIAIYADTRGRGYCRSCKAPIEWAEVVISGRRMPFDPPIVAVRTSEFDRRAVEEVDTTITKSHFATCPDSKAWRRR